MARSGLAVLLLLSGLTLFGAWANVSRCTGPTFDEVGRSLRWQGGQPLRDVCFSAAQWFWTFRDVHQHVFPYIHGGLGSNGELYGGAVEYPVLTGLVIWLGALFARTDAGFLIGTAVVLAPFGLLTTWMLAQLSHWRALLWALGPPVLLFAFGAWDLPPVACSVAAVYLVHRGWGKAGADRPLMQRALAAAVALGVGATFKLYPIFFVVPLALYVISDGHHSSRDLQAAIKVASAALATVVLINLPFAILGYDGWRASFSYQQERTVDNTGSQIWYWALRPWSDPDNQAFQNVIDVVSPVAVLASFAVACWVGWRRRAADGTFPWVAVSAAMLCGFLLFHKIHSPQYDLWVLPFLVLLRVRWQWIAAYLLTSIALTVGLARWFYHDHYQLPSGIDDGYAAQAVVIGTWGGIVVLVAMFFTFLSTRPTFFADQ